MIKETRRAFEHCITSMLLLTPQMKFYQLEMIGPAAFLIQTVYMHLFWGFIILILYFASNSKCFVLWYRLQTTKNIQRCWRTNGLCNNTRLCSNSSLTKYTFLNIYNIAIILTLHLHLLMMIFTFSLPCICLRFLQWSVCPSDNAKPSFWSTQSNLKNLACHSQKK